MNQLNFLIWILQGLLALWFVMPAYMKLTADGLPTPFRMLGVLELLGIIGIILPLWFNFLPVLTPITAVCFVIVMIGAFGVHFKKKEYKMLPGIFMALVLSVVVAYYRF